MNPKNKGKGKLIIGVYVNTSVTTTRNNLSYNTIVAVKRNGFIEGSKTGRNFALIVFDRDLYKKFILIGASKVEMDLPNDTSIYHRKLTPLLDGGNNLLFSTAQYCDFVVTLNDVANHHSGKKYIHDGDHIILVKSGKSLIYAPFQ